MDVDGLNTPDTGGPKSLSQVREETTFLKPPTTPQSSLESLIFLNAFQPTSLKKTWLESPNIGCIVF